MWGYPIIGPLFAGLFGLGILIGCLVCLYCGYTCRKRHTVKVNPKRKEKKSRYQDRLLTDEEIQNFDTCNQRVTNAQRNSFRSGEPPGPSFKEGSRQELNLQALFPPMLDEFIHSHQPREILEVTEDYVELTEEKGICLFIIAKIFKIS